MDYLNYSVSSKQPRIGTGKFGPRGSAQLRLPAEELELLRNHLVGDLVLPGHRTYDVGRKFFNARFDPYPAAIAYCVVESDVRLCIDTVRTFKVPFSIRAGGNSFAGYSASDGMIIDVGGIDDVFIDGRLRQHRVVRFGPLFRKDIPGVPFSIQDGIGASQHEIDGVIVDLHHLHVGRQPSLYVGAGGVDPFGREHNVVGSKFLAVVKSDAFAEVEPPACRLENLPAFGQPRNDFQVAVALSEALVDVSKDTMREGLIERIRVERFEIALKSEAQCRCVNGTCCRCKKKPEYEKRSCAFHLRHSESRAAHDATANSFTATAARSYWDPE
jgi:hypothetical protein